MNRAAAKVWDNVYDELGQLTSRTDTWGDATTFEYNKAGQQTKQIDSKSKSIITEYNVLGQKTKTTDRVNADTVYAFDVNGNLTAIPDAENQVTVYDYDAANRKIKTTWPDHVAGSSPGDNNYGIVQLDYDPAGRLLRRTDQQGDTVTFVYNLAGGLMSRDYRTKANSPSGAISDSDTFTLDDAGRVASAVSGRYSNTVAQTYDVAGRLASESLTIGPAGSQQTYTVSRQYDSRNQLSQLTYPDGTQVARTYDSRGLLSTLSYAGNVVDTRTYDSAGRLATSTYGNGVVTTYAYRVNGANKDNNLASIEVKKGTNTIDSFTYGYDSNKNVTSETRTGVMTGYGWTTDNAGASGFDDDDRLTYFKRSDNNLTRSWALSPVGDWNTLTTNSTPVSYTHGNAHELTAVGANAVSFDSRGNMTTSHNGHHYKWDADNRLFGVDTDGQAGDEVTFEYDALGRRVRQKTTGSGAVDTVYVLAGQQVIAEYVYGTAPASPTEKYVYASYIDEAILKDGTLASGTGIVYYHRDRRYSVSCLSDTTGTAVERYAYSPYGALTILDGAGVSRTSTAYNNAYTYTGRRWDSATGLYFFRARYFEPAAGIFLTRDPLEYVDGMSVYRGYFGFQGVDPTGKREVCCFFSNGFKSWKQTYQASRSQTPTQRCTQRAKWGWGRDWIVISATEGNCDRPKVVNGEYACYRGCSDSCYDKFQDVGMWQRSLFRYRGCDPCHAHTDSVKNGS